MMDETSGTGALVRFGKGQVLALEGPSGNGEDREAQTSGEGFEIVQTDLLEEVVEALAASEKACLKKVQGSSRGRGGEDLPTVSGRSVLERARGLQDLVSGLVKALERSEASVAELEERVEDLRAEKAEAVQELESRVEAAGARATQATERAEDAEYNLGAAEASLGQLKRVNRVLLLENAIAVEQLKRNNVAGVEIPLLKLQDGFPIENNLSGDFKQIKVTPLDPTSRQARVEASPIGKTVAGRDFDPLLTPELGAATPPPPVKTPESQSKLLERNRRRMLLVDQSPSTPTAIDTTNTTEAVDALVEDLMTRLQMVDLDISYRKLADFQYKIGEKKYHLRNINGRLFTRKGGGYQDLLVVLASFLRF